MSSLTITDILDGAAFAEIHDRIGALKWRDGKATAGKTAARVKQNEQADLTSAEGRAVSERIRKALYANPVFVAAARPRRMSSLLISRTADGGHYGPHVDNGLMKVGGDRLRTDLSFTLFLSAPDSYEGGELIVHQSGASQRLKGELGELVLYPSSDIHEVTPVTKGVRMVCVGWVESLIADPTQRALLFDLENLKVSLKAELPDGSAERLVLDKTIANLLRMWARP
ncbi:MAG: Fe2+-dependent dioxygenase [Pseudomonadota bacterium]